MTTVSSELDGVIHDLKVDRHVFKDEEYIYEPDEQAL